MASAREILETSMAQLLTAMIAVTFALGCGRQLNRQYCEANPRDEDCRNAGYVGLDAPMGCATNASCMDPTKPVCDTRTQQCEQCVIGVDTTACTGDTPQCGEDNLCHGCVYDAHCTSDVCLPDGKCAPEGTVLYARPNGTGDCSLANPCTLSQAVQMLTAQRFIVKLTVSQGTVYREPPIKFGDAFNVKVLGASTTFQPTADGDAISITAGSVEIVGLTVSTATGAGANGVSCSGNATLVMARTTVHDHPGWGINTTSCMVTIERSRISRNINGGMTLTAGTLEILNNIIDKNGNGNLETGNVQIRNAGGRLAFNTIVENLSKGGGGRGARIGGVSCTAGPGFVITRNIVAGNGDNEVIAGDCTFANLNYESTSIAGIGFGIDYRLTMDTPLNSIRDDPDAHPDCMRGGKFISDFEGQPRPNNFCDRGADEYHP